MSYDESYVPCAYAAISHIAHCMRMRGFEVPVVDGMAVRGITGVSLGGTHWSYCGDRKYLTVALSLSGIWYLACPASYLRASCPLPFSGLFVVTTSKHLHHV
jgi:hypothetical protein